MKPSISETLRRACVYLEGGGKERARLARELDSLADRLDTEGEPRVGDYVQWIDRDAGTMQGIILEIDHAPDDAPENAAFIACVDDPRHTQWREFGAFGIIARTGYSIEEVNQGLQKQ